MASKRIQPLPGLTGDRPKIAILLVSFLIMVAATYCYLLNPMALQGLRHAVFDQYQRWQPRLYQGSPVRIIVLDEESLQKHGQWPWPRTQIAELLDKLRNGHPQAIGFDIVFAEPDRTSPLNLSKLWRGGEKLRGMLSQLPDHDAVFAESLRQGGAVLGFVATDDPKLRGEPPHQAAYIIKGSENSFSEAIAALPLYDFSGALCPLPILARAAAGNGAVNFMFLADDDGAAAPVKPAVAAGADYVAVADSVVRRVPMLLRINGALFPSLSAETLRVAAGAANYTALASPQANRLRQIRIGGLAIPTNNSGEIWVHYTQPIPERYIPAWKILSGEIQAESLAGKILLVGASAKALEDLKLNPLGNLMPGVEAHAQAMEQILSGENLARPDWAIAIELPAMLIAVTIIACVSMRNTAGIAVSTLVTLLLMALLAAGAWLGFSRFGWLLDPLTPGFALLLSFVATGAINHFAGEKRQRWLKLAFSRYVSPNRVDYILKHPDDLRLDGQRRQCSFIFTDLAGFTQLMENIDPSDAVQWLNAYLDGMISIAFKYNGTLDRIVGDALAILFSAPLPQADHQRRALSCALEMQEFACQYANRFTAKGINFGQTRIGVHSGEVIVGNFGGATMFDYRALGDPVNTASRLESANKHLGTSICVSAATLSACADIPARPIGWLRLKGKNQALMAYQPFPPGTANDAQYQAAYALLADGNNNALQAFERLSGQRPDDPLVNLHLKRLRAGERGELVILEDK